MKTGRAVVGWVGFIVMLMFCLLVVWDYVTTRIRDHERRIAALEAEARPLIIVDRFSQVYLNGEEVKAEKIARAETQRRGGENAGND